MWGCLGERKTEKHSAIMDNILLEGHNATYQNSPIFIPEKKSV